MNPKHIDKLSEQGARDLLKHIVAKLDELDEDDYFGTEGRRHTSGLED